MAQPIVTSGVTPGPVSTSHQPPESVRDWVERHGEALEDTEAEGTKLETTWPSANGAQSTETTRAHGESNAEFLARHQTDYLTDMIQNPPAS